MAAEPYDIVVGRNDLTSVHVVPASPVVIGTDQVHVAIELYALTANNITYGVAGDTMKYWNFYPAAAGMGRIPVWGFGKVAQSNRPDVAAGERLYGYWPMSSDVVLTIGRITPAALTETSPNRAELASVYNNYVRVAADPGMPPGSEPYVSLVRPLFTTSFLIDDFLADNGFFGASMASDHKRIEQDGDGACALPQAAKARIGRRLSASPPRAMPRSSPGSARMIAS